MKKTILCAALAGIFSAGVAMNSQAAASPEKEKCFGIAQAGKNDCAAADGSHSCAGHATADKSAVDWKFVAKGECEGMGGMLAAENSDDDHMMEEEGEAN